MSLILDGTSGLSDVDGSAATPAIRGTDANTGMFFPAADTIAFSEGGVESMRLNSSGVLVTTNDASISGLTVGKGGGANAFATAIGNGALAATNTGSVLAVGYETLASNTSGDDITAVGSYRTLYSNTTGNNLVAVGRQALQANTTASFNTAIGHRSSFSNTTGANNSSLGYHSLYSNTTGGSNLALGQEALFSNTTASNNTAVGYQAAYTNTTATNNVAIGSQALYSSSTSSGNTAIGTQAGYSHNGTGGQYVNTFVGFQAGFAATTGYTNTFVGYVAGNAVTTGFGNVILGSFTGNGSGLDIRTGNNNIVLSDGAGTPRLYIGASGSMVINGAAIPSSSVGGAAFQVAGDGRMQLIQATTSTGTRALQEFYNPNGNVGSIGTSGSNAYYATTSDYRLKENIAPMTGALNKVALLKPCTYTWKNIQEDSQGFIAHELAEVCPQAVIGDKDDVDAEGKPIYQSIDTSFLVATLTASIQELHEIVKAQALEIAQLKGN